MPVRNPTGGARGWRPRATLIGGAAVLTVAALLTAGFSIDPLLKWWHSVWAVSLLSEGVGSGSAAQRSLRGAVLVVPPAPSGNDSSVSPTRRRLVLVEARPGRNAREGTARLGVDASSPQTYVAGAILVNGARLSEIYSDHVVLERDGRTARLGVGDSRIDAATSAADALLLVGGVQTVPGIVTKPSTDALTDYLRPSPVFDGSSLVGYQVYAGSHADAFARLGLQDGDVIKAVDGAPVTDAARTIEQLESLTQGRAVTASVLRQGRLETISLDGAVIAASRASAPVASPTGSQGSKNSH